MDAMEPLWCLPQVQAAVAADDAGALVRIYRLARCLTQRQLGNLVGYVPSTVSRIELGRLPLRDIEQRRLFASALDIPLHFFRIAAPGDHSARHARPLASPARVEATPTGQEVADPVRRRELLLLGLTGAAGAITNVGLRPSVAFAQPTLDVSGLERALLSTPTQVGDVTAGGLALAMKVAKAHFAAGRYTDLAQNLPDLIAAAHLLSDAAGDADHTAAHVRLAEVYGLASELLIKVGDPILARVSVDRSMTAALSSGSALAKAASARMTCIVLRHIGRGRAAQEFTLDAADRLDREGTHSASELDIYARMLSTAAYTAAVDEDRPRALELINQAEVAVRRLVTAAPLHRSATWAPAQITLYRVGIAYALGDAGTAIQVARTVRPDQFPTPERRARYFTDVARSWHQWGKPEQTYQALTSAYRQAPEEVRGRPSIRGIVTDLLRHDRRLPGLRAFAGQVGVSI
jgi:Predicted transcriptional regulators